MLPLKLLIAEQSYADIQIPNYQHLTAQLRILIKEDKIISDFPWLYLNGHLYQGERLRNHDIITFLCWRIIYFESYFLADLSGTIHCLKPKILTPLKELAAVKIKQPDTYHNRYTLRPLNYEIKLPPLPNLKNNQYHSGQALLLSLGMIITAAVNAYSAYRQSNYREVLLVLLLPSLMFLSAVFFPLYYRYKEKRAEAQKRKKYQKEVDLCFAGIEKNIVEDIENNTLYYRSFLFKADRADFYRIKKTDFNYLCFALGYCRRRTELTIAATPASAYSKQLSAALKQKYAYYEHVPLVLDLKHYRTAAFEVKGTKADFKAFIVNLCQIIGLSHAVKDLKVALVGIDQYLDDCKFLLEMPQLYLNRRRLLFQKLEDLYKLNLQEEFLVISTQKADLTKLKAAGYIYLSQTETLPHADYRFIVKDWQAVLIEQNQSLKFQFLYQKALSADVFYQTRYFLSPAEKDQSRQLKDLTNPTYLAKIKDQLVKPASIYACFGFDDAGVPLEFDISDAGIGPHMLVIGTSGSGKSNFIIAFLLNLAYRYRPQELSFALIDYKGSGLNDSLAAKGQLLKHIAMSINDLDAVDFDRSLTAFRLEAQRRKKLFRRLSALTQTSILCLKDYRCLKPERYGLPPIANLLIVIDEFAELKSEKAAFLSEIIKIARIGRSLGIYLLLATQKATAVVDEEIMANTNIKLALRLQNASESQAIIKTKAAAEITKPGEFYLQYAGTLVHGYAPYAHRYLDRKAGASVELLDAQLQATAVKVYHNGEDTLESKEIVETIIKRNDPSAALIFKPKLADIKLPATKDLREDALFIGRYDDYRALKQEDIYLDLVKPQLVTFIYHEEKEEKALLRLLLAGLAKTAIPRILFALKATGESFAEEIEYLNHQDPDDVTYFAHLLTAAPKKVVIIADYELLVNSENRHYYEEKLESYAKTQLFIILSASINSFSLRMLNIIDQRFLLSYKNKDEVYSFFGIYNSFSEVNVLRLAEHLVGFKYPLQVELKKGGKKQPPLIRKLPKTIDYREDKEKILIGYEKNSRKAYYCLKKEQILVTSFYDGMLEKFRCVYRNASIFHYLNASKLLPASSTEKLLFIGPNIQNQYLFPCAIRELKDDEAYLVQAGKGKVLKIIAGIASG